MWTYKTNLLSYRDQSMSAANIFSVADTNNGDHNTSTKGEQLATLEISYYESSH